MDRDYPVNNEETQRRHWSFVFGFFGWFCIAVFIGLLGVNLLHVAYGSYGDLSSPATGYRSVWASVLGVLLGSLAFPINRSSIPGCMLILSALAAAGLAYNTIAIW